MKGIFLRLSTKGYKHYTENTVEELDKLLLTNHYIVTEFAHLREWLRVNHGIWVYAKPVLDEDGEWIFKGYVKIMNDFKAKEIQTNLCRLPQEAYRSAFDYILKELI